jgi:hypothetical protein
MYEARILGKGSVITLRGQACSYMRAHAWTHTTPTHTGARALSHAHRTRGHNANTGARRVTRCLGRPSGHARVRVHAYTHSFTRGQACMYSHPPPNTNVVYIQSVLRLSTCPNPARMRVIDTVLSFAYAELFVTFESHVCPLLSV